MGQSSPNLGTCDPAKGLNRDRKSHLGEEAEAGFEQLSYEENESQ